MVVNTASIVAPQVVAGSLLALFYFQNVACFILALCNHYSEHVCLIVRT